MGSRSAFGSWAADVEALQAPGHVGLCLPADALGTPAALDGLGPVLETLERLDLPLFVHPVAHATATHPPGGPP